MTDLIKLMHVTDRLREHLVEAEGEKKCRAGEEWRDGKCRNIKGGASSAKDDEPVSDIWKAQQAREAKKSEKKMKREEAKKADVAAKDMQTLSKEAFDLVGDWNGGSPTYRVAEKLKDGEAVSDKELNRAISTAYGASARASEAEDPTNSLEKAERLAKEKKRAWAAYQALDKVRMKRQPS